MPATYSSNLRLTKQGDGDNSTTWGQVVNTQVIELLEDAISGVVDIDCTGSSNVNISTTTVNGGEDDARNMILELTGTLGANIQLIVPATEKMYIIRADFSGGYTINVRPSGGSSGIDLVNGDIAIVYTSGTSIYQVGGSNYLRVDENLADLASVSTARTNLGLGTAAVLDVGTTANKIVQLDGTGKLPAVDGSQLTGLATVAVGTIASQNANNVTITGGTITGITDLAIADGGTGASTAAQARTNLGIGTLGTLTGSVTTGASGKIVIGGVTIQWGITSVVNNSSSTNVTFGTAFSSTPYSIVATPVGATWQSSVNNAIAYYTQNVAASSFTLITRDSDTFSNSAFYWIAIGPT